MQATLAFWTVESLEAVNIFTYGGEAAAEYPMNVYAAWFRNFLIFVVPVGCVIYLPMLAAMGRHGPAGRAGLGAAVGPRRRFRLPRRRRSSSGVSEFATTPPPGADLRLDRPGGGPQAGGSAEIG